MSQDGLCICKRFNHILYRSCGIPTFNDVHQHDNTIMSIPKLCVTFPTGSTFGSIFEVCENKCFDSINDKQDIRFSYHKSDCYGYSYSNGCITLTYEVRMNIINI
jgi:hypothetical protein